MISAAIDLVDAVGVVVGDSQRSREVAASCRRAGAVVEIRSSGFEDRLSARDHDVPDFVYWVDGPTHLRAKVRRLCRRNRIAFLGAPSGRSESSTAVEASAPPIGAGSVTLVGGGPGAPELITVAGHVALSRADVVLHDRLAPRELLAEVCSGAELIDVGKSPGRHALPQEEIERLMVQRARQGLRVVRLKGGDPFVFGRGGEEIATCRAAGVDVTALPGVSSAIAVPGAAGIPVTYRGVAHSFTVISAHAIPDDSELAWLAATEGTLVVLMGVATLPALAAGLLRHGMPAQLPVAIIERGCTAAERSHRSTLGAITDELIEFAPVSPAVIVIGPVVEAIEAESATAPSLVCNDEAPVSALDVASTDPANSPMVELHPAGRA